MKANFTTQEFINRTLEVAEHYELEVGIDNATPAIIPVLLRGPQGVNFVQTYLEAYETALSSTHSHLDINLIEICLEGDFDVVSDEVSEYGINDIYSYWEMGGRIAATPSHFRPSDEVIYEADHIDADKVNIMVVYANSSSEVTAYDIFLDGLEDVVKKIYNVDKVKYLLRPAVNYSMPSYAAWLYSQEARDLNREEFERGCLMAECARMNHDLDRVDGMKSWAKLMVSQSELNVRLTSTIGLESFFIIDPAMVFGRAEFAHHTPLEREDKFHSTYSFLSNFIK